MMRPRRLRMIMACMAVLLAGPFASGDEIPLAARKSGSEFMSRQTQDMQNDDTSNPAMLWVLEGETLWSKPAGTANKSCSSCHRDAATSMKGVAASYPAFDETSSKVINLEQRINLCRTEQQKASPLAYESRDLLALTAYLARQSKGMPIEAKDDSRTRPFREAGEKLYSERVGQLNLSCAQCHTDNWGQKLGSALLPQAHPTAYPLYRLEWQTVGSLQRRLRNCMIGMRAEPYAYGDQEFVNLELYLMWRARGMTMEAPGVRP
ncbi:sulfur oxidation c-type cytochrome SoxA [Roseiarcaceae bacterium H3SJ34-1]|uniref:sulfur oxidation c-type cytochrome SoxA n=1 Tax=Terripilifer ovatus TaxID=3032367 RepID=UPI003AB9A3A1|nr:sulfur oxidation c-type cytochrome SoxA [Roseiarcaceae bacterium H3SJ34-1]